VCQFLSHLLWMLCAEGDKAIPAANTAGITTAIFNSLISFQDWVVQRRPVLIGVVFAEGVGPTGCGRAEKVEMRGVDNRHAGGVSFIPGV
jgi:hypothetical protein